jgi:hypothetical protein
MTNDETEVPDRIEPNEMQTYGTAEADSATTPVTTGTEESPQRLVTVRGDGTVEGASAEKPAPGPAGVVTSPPAPVDAATTTGTTPGTSPAAATAPSETAAAERTDPASVSGWRVEPRTLFERKREPPQFIVSIVEPSAGPLSTSLQEVRPSISSTGSSGVLRR